MIVPTKQALMSYVEFRAMPVRSSSRPMPIRTGGGLPLQHHSFFAPGSKCRVPMYLATSFSDDKAYEFWH